jgi:adenylate kinase
MVKVILITGTPGAGKTTISSQIDLPYYNIFELANRLECIDGYDEIRNASIIDEHKLKVKLETWLNSIRDPLIIIEGHISNIISKKYLSHCFVLSPPQSIIFERLKKRGYSKDKIRENMDAHILKECYYDALENYGKNNITEIFEIDTEKIKAHIKNSIP